jgi:hypothetical protein
MRNDLESMRFRFVLQSMQVARPRVIIFLSSGVVPADTPRRRRCRAADTQTTIWCLLRRCQLRRASLSGSDLEEVGEREKIRFCFGVGNRTDEEIFVHMEGKVLAILGTRCPEFSQHCSGRAGGAGFFGETKEFFIRQEFDRARVKSRGEHGALATICW